MPTALTPGEGAVKSGVSQAPLESVTALTPDKGAVRLIFANRNEAKGQQRLMKEHGFFMDQALESAGRAFREGEVPVGAVLVFRGEIIARAFNRRERDQNPLGHAELSVLKQASEKLGTWRLSECSLYVTLEPCLMCTGALLQARVEHLIYGCPDLKGGCVTSLYRLTEDSRFNHKMRVTGGIRKERCSALLKAFFKNLRNKSG